MDRSRYPACWDDIAGFMKRLNNWECENCGRPCRRPGEGELELYDRLPEQWRSQLYESIYDEELGDVTIPRLGRFTLTVAHLDHNPPNVHPENLRPWCAPCHGRYDLQPSALARKRQLKLENDGQLNLLDALSQMTNCPYSRRATTKPQNLVGVLLRFWGFVCGF